MMEYYEAMMDASESSLQTFQESPLGGLGGESDYGARGCLDMDGNQRQTVVKFPADKGQLAQVVTTDNDIINREDITEEDRALLYYSTADYTELKAEARMESLACERDGTKKYLEDVFVEKCKKTQENLYQWVGSCDTVVEGGLERRGLERMANQTLSNIRQQAQFHAVMEVLRAQDELLVGRFITDPEEVRRVSIKATRVARHFARMIAKADALAVNADMNEASPKRISGSGTKAKSSSKKLVTQDMPSLTASSPPSPNSKKGHKDKKDKATKKKDKDKKEKDHDKDKKEKDHDKKDKKEKDKKEKDKDKSKEHKSTIKQKFKETKAGIMSRMQRRDRKSVV